MEEIITQFSNNLLDDGNHTAYYKLRGEEKHNQEKRRLELLKSQKEKRSNLHDATRGILDLIQENEYKLHLANQHDEERYMPRFHAPGFLKFKPLYTDTLMLSEWMIERPEDLETNWFALACPKGKRVLVVASNGKTKAYLKYGNFYKEWKSTLPGGNHQDFSKNCVLDCFITDQQILYVLDVLAWGNISMTDCEHEFRYFWLKSKFAEVDVTSVSNLNELSIRLIERYDSTIEGLSKLLGTWPAYPGNTPPVDGLLFYHKKAFYVKNYTPLVVWLFPYMIKEVIGEDIMVHNQYMEEKPKDYTNKAEFIEKFEMKLSNKKSKIKKYVLDSLSSSGSSPDSSLNSSTTSLESFGNGQVHYVFKAKADSSRITKNKWKKNGKNRKKACDDMEVAVGDVSSDSALGLMDESISIKFEDAECMQ